MSYFKDLKKFIDSSPTAIDAADTIEKQLQECGFKQYFFSTKETLPKGEKIYFKHKGLIAAFCLPSTKLNKACYVLAHTDSPCLKVKPDPFMTKEGLNFLVCEPYGSPLLSSYLGRPLQLVGQIALDTKEGIKIEKIKLDRSFLIPDPAIHLSKESNASLDKGKIHALIGKQEELSFEKLLSIKDPLLAHDLYLVPANSLLEMGSESKFFAGPRMDNLSSCFALVETLKKTTPLSNTLLAAFFFDHEEIGSDTIDGAKSHLIKKRVNKIIQAYQPDDMLDLHSMAYSLDVAHANHPGFLDKFDEQHPCILGDGVVIKHHSQHKYAQDLNLFAYAKKELKKAQVFTMRNEVGTGSTLGPYFSSLFSIPTQDIGLPVLSMHSCMEIIAENDLKVIIEFLQGFFDVK